MPFGAARSRRREPMTLGNVACGRFNLQYRARVGADASPRAEPRPRGPRCSGGCNGDSADPDGPWSGRPHPLSTGMVLDPSPPGRAAFWATFGRWRCSGKLVEHGSRREARRQAGERIRDKFAASRRKGMWMGRVSVGSRTGLC
jgi:hypothetical protein